MSGIRDLMAELLRRLGRTPTEVLPERSDSTALDCESHRVSEELIDLGHAVMVPEEASPTASEPSSGNPGCPPCQNDQEEFLRQRIAEGTDNQILATIDGLARSLTCFDVSEITGAVDVDVDLTALEKVLVADERFVRLSASGSTGCFISAEGLFRWWGHLTARLAIAGRNQLSDEELLAAMRSFRSQVVWETPPPEVIDFGRRFGFVRYLSAENWYVFPLAACLSHVSPVMRVRAGQILPQLFQVAWGGLAGLAKEVLSIDSDSCLPGHIEPVVPPDEGEPLEFEEDGEPEKPELDESAPFHAEQDTERDQPAVDRSGSSELQHVDKAPPSPSGVVPQNARFTASHISSEHRVWKALVADWVSDALGTLTPREERVLRLRFGLEDGRARTLEEVGREFKVTRARIGQIEDRGFRKLCHPTRNRRLFYGFLFDLMVRQGSLVVAETAPDITSRILTAKCLEIPLTEVQECGMVLVGVSRDSVAQCGSTSWSDGTDDEPIAARLISRYGPCLSDSDIRILVDSFKERVGSRPGQKAQKVRIAMQKIGKHAHYSEISEVYNSLFPVQPLSEHNIHAILSREPLDIVWIGVRGTYALKAWGYERPSDTLFDSAAEIVERKFAETGRPVSFETITAEIARYRQIVVHSSLIFATHFNPRIKRVHGTFFVPRSDTDVDEEEDSSDELDRILREFEGQQGNL